MSDTTFVCPTCREAVERSNPEFPFCSSHCRNQDLVNWANESYSIPGEPAAIPDPDDPHTIH